MEHVFCKFVLSSKGGKTDINSHLELRELYEMFGTLKKDSKLHIEMNEDSGKDIVKIEIHSQHNKIDVTEFVNIVVHKIPLLKSCMEKQMLEVKMSLIRT